MGLTQPTNFGFRPRKTIKLRVSEFSKFSDGLTRVGKTLKGRVNYIVDKIVDKPNQPFIMAATRNLPAGCCPRRIDQREVEVKPFVRGSLEYSHSTN